MSEIHLLGARRWTLGVSRSFWEIQKRLTFNAKRLTPNWEEL